MSPIKKIEWILPASEVSEYYPISVDAHFEDSPKKKSCILFIHGFKGFKDWGSFNHIAQTAAQAGFIFVKLNLSHNGVNFSNPSDFVDLEAFGKGTISMDLSDCLSVIDYLLSDICPLPIDRNYFNLIGHSRGGALALLSAAERKAVKKLSTWGGIHDFEKTLTPEQIEAWKRDETVWIKNNRTGQQMPIYPKAYWDYIDNKARLYVPSRLPEINSPVLIAHGTDDQTIPYQVAQFLHTNIKNSVLELFDNASHTFGSVHPHKEENLHPDTQNVLRKTLEFFA